jgi:hypothetical protein
MRFFFIFFKRSTLGIMGCKGNGEEIDKSAREEVKAEEMIGVMRGRRGGEG